MTPCDIIMLLLFGLAIVGQAKSLELYCGPGEYVDRQLMECQDCAPQTYSSTRDQADRCANCTQRCFDRRNAVVLYSCNSTHDMRCQCKDGLFAPSDRFMCKKHTTCPENCLKHPGSASTNTVCYEPCPTTSPVNELSVQSSTGSTAVVTNDQSTASSPNLSSNLLNVTTSSSNQTASDNFLQKILLPVVITVPIIILAIVSICYWEKICECLNLKRNYREHVYQGLPMNGGDQHPAVNHPPQPPHRNALLGSGSDGDGTHQQFNGSDQIPATPSLGRGAVDVFFQDLPPHDDSVLPEVLPNEALIPVPNSQALPLESETTAEEASSDEAAAILPESQHDGSSSRPLSHHEDLLPEDDYAQARLLSGPTDIQDSLTGHDSEELGVDTSNSEYLGAGTSNTEDIRGSLTMLGLDNLQSLSSGPVMQDNRRTSAKPCACVQPFVIVPQPNRNLQANNLQHASVHQQQHPQMNHPQQYQPPDVPNQIVAVESVDSLSQGDELA